MQPNFHSKKFIVFMSVAVFLFVIWCGMFCSLGAKQGYIITDWINEMNNIYIPLLKKNAYGLKNPLWFKPYLNQYTSRGIMMSLATGTFIVIYIYAIHGKYIYGKEFGTSKYANPHAVNRELRDKNTPPEKIYKETVYVRKWYKLFLKTKTVYKINTANRRISENIYMTMNTRQSDRNNNIFLVGGSGAGKSFRFARNILRQMNGSYIVTDPKGELVKKEGGYLEERGYDVKVLNLLDTHSMKKSVRYNPFAYIRDEVDVLRLAKNIMANTSVKDAKPQDPFFDEAAEKLLQSLIFYTWEVYKDNQKEMNFGTVMRLLQGANVVIDPETNQKVKSPLDQLMDKLEIDENRRIARETKQGKIPRPMSEAVVKYNSIMRSAPDTVRSIVVTLDSRLSNLHIPELLSLLSDDEINIKELGLGRNYDGKTKTALFLVIPDTDTSFNFVAGMLYTQINQILAYTADHVCGGELQLSVTMLMDEFANIALPDDFDKMLSTMRSRNLSAIIMVQNLAQIKKLFEKDWESITGNCDTFIYLGGNEQGSHKYVSEMMDKGTYDKRTHGETRGVQGSSNRNWDVIGRELLTPGEVRKLNRKKCIVLISGFDPIIDEKIRTNMHPLFKYIKDKENFSYDRRKKVKRGGMYFVGESFEEAMKRQEEYEETKKIITIDGDALMKLPSEAIDAYSEKKLYSELTEDLIAIDIKKTEELRKNIQLTDDELLKLNEGELQVFLLFRSDGYTDRQIKALLKLINAGKSQEEVRKMFQPTMEADRIESLVERLVS